jgi:O-succinylbenzoic acid--CoA ligase
MSHRRLLAHDAADPALVQPLLAAALAGTGPALLPLPGGPEPARRALLAALDPDQPLERDDVAVVVPTSGSTGTPKGALLTADAVRASVRATHRRLDGPGRWVLALPVTHVAGLMVLARSLEAGTDPVVVDLTSGFRPEAFAAAVPERASDPLYTSLVPTQLGRLLDAGTDLDAFAAVLLGGGPAPPGLVARARAQGVRVVTTYGMSETCGGCVYDGTPLDGVAVDLTTDGRVRIGGPVLCCGYRLRPDLTAQAFDPVGRLVTQDVGRIAADGRLEVLGRADDVVVTGGVNVPAALVESVLAGHPAVGAVAVVGVPDPRWGQRVVAVVAPAAHDAGPELAELRRFAADRLPPAALPRQLVIVAQLPVLAPGKPDRRAVRGLVAADSPADPPAGSPRGGP